MQRKPDGKEGIRKSLWIIRSEAIADWLVFVTHVRFIMDVITEEAEGIEPIDDENNDDIPPLPYFGTYISLS